MNNEHYMYIGDDKELLYGYDYLNILSIKYIKEKIGFLPLEFKVYCGEKPLDCVYSVRVEEDIVVLEPMLTEEIEKLVDKNRLEYKNLNSNFLLDKDQKEFKLVENTLESKLINLKADIHRKTNMKMLKNRTNKYKNIFSFYQVLFNGLITLEKQHKYLEELIDTIYYIKKTGVNLSRINYNMSLRCLARFVSGVELYYGVKGSNSAINISCSVRNIMSVAIDMSVSDEKELSIKGLDGYAATRNRDRDIKNLDRILTSKLYQAISDKKSELSGCMRNAYVSIDLEDVEEYLNIKKDILEEEIKLRKSDIEELEKGNRIENDYKIIPTEETTSRVKEENEHMNYIADKIIDAITTLKV